MKWRRKREAPVAAPTAVTVDRHVVEPPSAPEPARVVPERRRPAERIEHVQSLSGTRYVLRLIEGDPAAATVLWRAGRGLPTGRLCTASVPWRKFGEPDPPLETVAGDWPEYVPMLAGDQCWVYDPTRPAFADPFGDHHAAPRGNPRFTASPDQDEHGDFSPAAEPRWTGERGELSRRWFP